MRLFDRRSGLWLLVGFVTVLGAACAPAQAPVRIDSVSPSRLPNPQAALLLVAGDGFRKGDVISLSQAGTVGLSLRALDGAVWVNSRLLSVPLPVGLALGQYDVVVTDPDGRQATRQSALQIGTPEPTRAPATATPTAAVTERPRAKATLPPPTPTAERTESPTRSPTPAPTEPATATATPQPTPILPPARPPATATATTSASGRLDVSGHWQLIDTIQPSGVPVTFADLVLQQQGNNVSGSSPDGLVALNGVLDGNTLRANYVASNGQSGTFVWTFSADGASFNGGFTAPGVNSGTSAGTRTSGALAPAPVQAVVLSHGRGQSQASHGHGAHGGD